MARGLHVNVGEVFGKLSIVAELPIRQRSGGGTERWFRCICECGNETDVPLKRLRSGKTRSCGCLPKAASADFHGMENSTEYGIWKGIKKRCYDVGAKGYSRYGGRGIVICGGWKSSFKSFFADMGARPSLKHSIDRKDNDGHYSCGHCEECLVNGWTANCKWSTQAEQRRNASNVRMLTFRGETLCMADWAKRYGMSKGTLLSRLDGGMSLGEALLTPVRQWRTDKKFLTVDESQRDSEWKRELERRKVRGLDLT